MKTHLFKIEVSQLVLDDLQARLADTRWPDALAGSGWEQGADLDYMQELAAYWRTGFDWRAQEAALNRYNHFRAEIDGLMVHYVHERGKGPQPLPLIITHGWPGSFAELLNLIPLLTDPARFGADPADAFDVVAPSMPGFGFSDRPTQPGMNVWRMADLWAELMTGLGYERFGAQGGDFGAGVTTILGLNHPARLRGIHLNYIPGSYQPDISAPSAELTEEERQFLREADEWYQLEGGYSHQQRTKPQTIAYGLNDSPVALVAWIVEKFQGWSDCAGEVERRFTKDELLTNVMIYWVTQTIGSSMRLYYEVRQAPLHFQPGQFVSVPCGIAHFPLEAPFPPRGWIERGYNVRHWTDMPRGGHFAAMEEPQLLAEDIRAFFRPLRDHSGY